MNTRIPLRRLLALLPVLLAGAADVIAQSPMPTPALAPSPQVLSATATARGGRGGGLPNATPEQIQAVGEMNAALVDLVAAVSAARTELSTATYADRKDDAAIRAKSEALRAAEYALAVRRADEFARIQAGPARLTSEQVMALVNGSNGVTIFVGGGGGGGGRGRGARGN